ncbi:uncharacterized protein LOC118410870 [Branchiostoma floridae]|uniref:Uncharacterized protein LOC118410870 n=1 Tax=Branchiostoma floridae TaxID=7739 RepID=A0A9J7KQZ3_BRAFL|nr:uncharacterized protein LOC118410870 [Branchiostoma floridae]
MPQLMKVMMPTMQAHAEKGRMEHQTAGRKEQEWLSAGAKEQEYFSDRHKRLLWHLQSKQAKGQHMSKKELNSLKWLKKRQRRATQMERQKLQVQEQRSTRSRKDQRQSEERRGMKRGSRERYLPDQRKVSKQSPSRQVARLERVGGQQRKRRDSGREEQQPVEDGQSEARHSKSHQLAVDVEKMLLQKEWERLAGERKALDYELALREAAVQEHVFQMQHAVYTHKVTREVTQVTQHSKHLPLEAGTHGDHSEQLMSANHDVDYRHVQVTSESSSLSGDRSHKHFPGDPHLDDRSLLPYDHKRLHGDPVLDDRSLIPYDQDHGRFHTDLLHGDSSLMCPDDTAPRDWSPERDAKIPYYRRQPQYEEDWQGRSYSFKSDEEDEFLHDPYRRDALADRYGEPYRPKQAVGSYRDDPPFLVPGSLPYDNSVFSAEPPPDIRDAPYIRNDRRQEQTLRQASHVDFVRSLQPGQSPYYDLDEFGWPVAPSPHEGYKSPPVVPGFHGNLRHGNRQSQGHSQMPGKMKNKAGKRNKSRRDQHRNPRSNSQSWGRDPRSNSQNQGRDPRSNSQGRDHRSSSQSFDRDHRSNSQSFDTNQRSNNRREDQRSSSESQWERNNRSSRRGQGRDHRSRSQSRGRDSRSNSQSQGRDSRSNSQSQSRDSRSNSQSQGRDSRSNSQGQGISGDHSSISQRQGGHRFTQSFDPGQSRDRSQYNSQPGQNNIQQKPAQTGRNSQNSAKRQRSGSPSPRGTKKGPGEMGAPKCPPKQQQTVDTQMWPLQAPGTVMQQNVQIPNSQAMQSQDFGLIQDNQTMQSQDFGQIQDNQTMQSQDFGQIQDNQTMQSQDFGQIQDNQTMQSQDFGQIQDNQTMQSQDFGQIQDNQTMQSQDFGQIQDNQTMQSQDFGQIQDNQTMQSQVFGQLPTKEATRPQEISQRVQSSWHDDCLEGDFLDFGKESAVSFQGSIQQTVLPAASATRETSTFSGGDVGLLSPTGKTTDRPESEQVACLPPVVIPPGLSFTEKLLVVVETFGPITKQEVQKRLPKFELEVKKEVVNRRRTYDDLLIDQLGDSIPEQHRWKLKLLRRIIVDTMSQTTPEGREKVSWLCHQLLPQEGIELTDEVLKALMAKRMLVNPLLKPMVITGMGAGIGTTAKRSRKSVVTAYLQQQGIRPTEETVRDIVQNEQMVDKILKTLGHQQQLFGAEAEASQDTHQGAGVSQGTHKDTLLGATVNTAVSQAGILPSEGNAALSSNRESQPLPCLSSERTGPECMPNEEKGGNTALSSNRESQSLPGPSSERKGPKKGPRRMPNEERGGTLILTPFAQKLAAFVEKTYGKEKKIKIVNRINTFEEELKGNAEFFWKRGQNNDKMIEQLAERLQLPHGSVWKLQLLRRVSVDCLPKKTVPARERILEMCQHVLFDEGIKVTDEIFKVILAIVPRHLQGSLATTTRDPTSSVASIRESSGLTSGKPTSFVENLRESSGMTSGNPTPFVENLRESSGMTTGYPIPFAEETLEIVPSTSTGGNMALPSNREPQSLPSSSLQGPIYDGPMPKELRGGTLILTPFAQKLVAFVKKTYGKKIETRVVDRINTFEEERKGNPDFFWTRIQNNDMVIKQIAERRNLPPESFWKLQLLRRVTMDCLPKTNLPQRVLQMCQHLLFNEGVAVTDEIFKVIVTRISKNPQPPTPFVENLQDSSAMTTGYSIPFVKGEMLRTVPSTSTGGQSSSTSTGGQSSVPNTHSQTLEQVSDKHQMVVAYLMSMGVHVTTEAVEGILQNQQALDSIERIFWTPIQDRQLVQEYLQMINIPVTPDAVNKIMENPELMRRIKNTLGAPGANVGPPGTSRGGQ